jgi:hypothetical protein
MGRFLRETWYAWKRIAERIGHFQARVLWGFLYFVLVTPFALGVKIFADPLRIRRRSSSSWWLEHPRQTSTLEEARRQF